MPASSRTRNHSGVGAGIVLAAPAVLLLTMFVLWPLVTAVQYSGTSASGYGDMDPVGLDNFARAAADEDLYASLIRNLVFAALVVIVSVVVGFMLAYLLYLRVAGWRALQLLFMVPYVMPVVVVALLWQFMLEPENGLVNAVLRLVGLDAITGPWLTGVETSLGTVSFVQAWVTVPFATLILLASMTSLSAETLEAAELDGAGHWSKMTRIVLPGIRSSVVVTAIIIAINCFRSFDLVYLLTRGGPVDSTTIATLYVYVQGFVNNEYGYANAVGIVISVVLIVLAAIPVIVRARASKEGKRA